LLGRDHRHAHAALDFQQVEQLLFRCGAIRCGLFRFSPMTDDPAQISRSIAIIAADTGDDAHHRQ
jgi:hypothetical protein